ncbi:FAD-dependent oxidoreductase [Eubacteriales bacterium OttesenSCG-928-K08]|nr:FAD-dependent oxidoreductase [Eubacteriales bacterium OttesenSCG-928-K08]
MALLLSDIRLPLDADMNDLPGILEKAFGIPKKSVQAIRIVRQSLDARKKNDIHFQIGVVAQLERRFEQRLLESDDKRVAFYKPMEAYALKTGDKTQQGRIVIAGLGPAGLFAAYFLARAGYRPLCVERGRDIDNRKRDVDHFWATGELNNESNVTFGEGGAGTFSDGKLTTRSKNERAQVVLETFAEFGAPPDILYQAKPHIGTDYLQNIVKNMREAICRAGGEVCFETKLENISVIDGRLSRVILKKGERKEKIETAALVLATGQAARDTYEMLLSHPVMMQPKAFAVGVRIEHPQGLIDSAQFGALAGHPRLGAAEYRLTARGGSRGVYTFCMCPGGEVVNAASGPEQVVVNGMSQRARNGKNANSAIVVQVSEQDFGREPLSGLRFQQELERKAYLCGGGNFSAPAQRVEDFIRGSKSARFQNVLPTCRPGVTPHRLDTMLPDYIAGGIQSGIKTFSRQLKGFDNPDAVLSAVESRTSSPVRIVRNELGNSPGVEGLYPVGEGAGYAGGIVSAAIDGMMAAERIASIFAPNN